MTHGFWRLSGEVAGALPGDVLAGFGGYFLEYKQEESDNGAVRMTSKGLHSLGQLAGGLGLEGRFSQHTIAGTAGGTLPVNDPDPAIGQY